MNIQQHLNAKIQKAIDMMAQKGEIQLNTVEYSMPDAHDGGGVFELTLSVELDPTNTRMSDEQMFDDIKQHALNQ